MAAGIEWETSNDFANACVRLALHGTDKENSLQQKMNIILLGSLEILPNISPCFVITLVLY